MSATISISRRKCGPAVQSQKTRFCQIAVSVTPERPERRCDREQAFCQICARILRACRIPIALPEAVVRRFPKFETSPYGRTQMKYFPTILHDLLVLLKMRKTSI